MITTLNVTVLGFNAPSTIKISVAGLSKHFNQKGAVGIFKSLTPGTYQITATAIGYESVRSVVDIDPTYPGMILK